jgi:hypothetical protein
VCFSFTNEKHVMHSSVRASARECANVHACTFRVFASFRKLGGVPPECKISCFFVRNYTNYVKKCQKTSKNAHFFVKIVFFSKRSGELCKSKNAPQGVLSAWQKPANLYSTKCRIFGAHPPPRAQHRGGKPRTQGQFWGTPKTRRPAGAVFHESATPVSPKYIFKNKKYIFFYVWDRISPITYIIN